MEKVTEFFQRREHKCFYTALVNQRQKARGWVTAHALKNSRARKECCPQANNFRAIFLPSKLAMGNRCHKWRMGGREGICAAFLYVNHK